MIYLAIKAYIIFLCIAIILVYDLCPKYKCDSGLKSETCGKIKKVKDSHTNEFYNEYSLFPCMNHKKRCQISQISENSDAICKEEAPIITSKRQIEDQDKKY